MTLEAHERSELEALARKLESLRDWLQQPLPAREPVDWQAWSAYLAGIKGAVGNLDNGASFVACMLAKEYLAAHHSLKPYDAGAKRQGAAGMDVDVVTVDGKRVAGEIKTTEPYGENDFGARQRDEVLKDLERLEAAEAAHKYFFVVSPRAYRILQKRYAGRFPGVTIVLLGAPPASATAQERPWPAERPAVTRRVAPVPTVSSVRTGGSLAEQIRRYVRDQIVEPARQRGQKTVTFTASEIHNGLGLRENRMPSVCQAIDTPIFLDYASVTLVRREGPQLSTTAKWTFAV